MCKLQMARLTAEHVKGFISPDYILSKVNSTQIPFKSSRVKDFTSVLLGDIKNFDPRFSQLNYTRGLVVGDVDGVQYEIKKLKELLPLAESRYVNAQKNELEKDRLPLIKDIVDELKNVISFLESELPKLKERAPLIRITSIDTGKEFQEYAALQYGELDAKEGRNMNPTIVNLAGTDKDNIAKSYTDGYVRQKESMSKGGKKKSRKSKTKKVRKTRRVKKLNGGN